MASKLRLGIDLSFTILSLHTKFRPPSLSCVNSLSLLLTWTVEHFSLHGERASNNKVSEWLSFGFWQVKSRKSSKPWLYYLSPHWSPSWISQWLWSFSSKNLLFFYSVHWSLAPEYESTAVQGPQRHCSMSKPIPYQYLLTSLRVQQNITEEFCSCRKTYKRKWIVE